MKANLLFLCLLLLLSVTVYPQEFTITIDAEKDAYYNTLTGPNDGWLWIPSAAFNGNGQPTDDVDLSANWYSAWDDTYFYFYEEVTDDIVNLNNTTWWGNDILDVKIDPDLGGIGTGSAYIFTCAMTCLDSFDVDAGAWAGVRNIIETDQYNDTNWPLAERPTPVDYARKLTDNGYVLELRLKWEWTITPNALKGPIVPAVGGEYGMAISIHDNDATGREASIEWAAALTDLVWSEAANHGTITLLADHKIKYLPESPRDPLIVNPNPDMYNPPGTAVSEQSAVVKNFALFQNYPNPFNPVTTISFNLSKRSKVNISVYDLLGHKVVELLDEVKPEGQYNVHFEGTNLSSGVYVCRMAVDGNQILTRKMTLMK